MTSTRDRLPRDGFQLRDSLFAGSAAGRGSREMAVDAALEQARSAPLSLQMGIRQGAGRVDSLLGGEGPQPVRIALETIDSVGHGGHTPEPFVSVMCFSRLLFDQSLRRLVRLFEAGPPISFSRKAE